MKVKVSVATSTRYVVEYEADTVEDAVRQAKFEALFSGDFISQEAEYEVITSELIAAKPPRPRKLVLPKKRPAYKRHTYCE